MSATKSEDRHRIELAKRVALNPFEYLTVEEIGELFNFGERSMAALRKLGAPIVAKRMNPASFKAWLDSHQDEIGKLVQN